ncbi:YqgE/AlgH family protein [Euryhalocaulis caribicus]|uniref:YqgE/AlgH family protein n=1 Tax=Euryhalocaulis caribicus TaxID=1161401 RepID=UPI001F525D25|nr:YqgE/AlgH family protein [Euryhalocaulis caribicus]
MIADMEETPEEKQTEKSPLIGQMLIATPAIGDERFERSVIVVCAHSDDHAMGIVVNKPMGEIRLGDLLDQLGIESTIELPDRQVLAGGPVDKERGFVLHSDDYHSDDSTVGIRDGLGLTATKEVLEAIASETAPQQSTLALGYAGWGPGQLEEELRASAWLTCEASEALVFGEDLETKWESALRSIGVNPAMLSSMTGMA